MIEFIYQSYAALQKGRAILNLEISICTVKPGLGKLREGGGGLPEICDPIQLSSFYKYNMAICQHCYTLQITFCNLRLPLQTHRLYQHF